MDYTYRAWIQFTRSSTGAFVDYTTAPTIAAYSGRTGDAISGAAITKVVDGVYILSVEHSVLEPVLMTFVPHTNDQATHASVAVLAVMDLADAEVESDLTVRDVYKIMIARIAGKVSGGGTTQIRYRDVADELDRIIFNVDQYGNRTSVALDTSDPE